MEMGTHNVTKHTLTGTQKCHITTTLNLPVDNMPQPAFSPEFMAWLRPITEPPSSSLIPYIPVHEALSFEWKSATELLNHLLCYPPDRDRLRAEARRRSPKTAKIYIVDHPLLRRALFIGSQDSDKAFLYFIQDLISQLEFPQRVRRIQEILKHAPSQSNKSSPSP
jgi:hypothetical protein